MLFSSDASRNTNYQQQTAFDASAPAARRFAWKRRVSAVVDYET
jgi:hypothetical protein